MTAVLYAALAGPNTTSDLYTVDPVTGVMTSVGPIGAAISGLAVDPTSGILYGSVSFNSAALNGSLLTIDTTTGAGTLVGSFGLPRTAHEIAFDATGQLWGFSGEAGGEFWSIDKATGAATLIATTSHVSGGLDFDSLGTLWSVGCYTGTGPHIGTVDTSTGAFTQISDPSDSNFMHSGKFDALGVFWASDPGESGLAGTNLVTVDVASGVVTPVAPFSVPGVGGLAWVGTGTPLRADFSGSPRHGSAPLSVNFTDLSTPGPSGPITGWAWTFGDGGTSSVQNPTYIYTNPGHYTVTLTVTGTGPDGTSTKTRTAYILVTGPATLLAALAGHHGTSDLYTVDAGTAVMTSIGPLGYAVAGIAQDPTTGDVYGSTSHRSSNNPLSLIKINPNTGAGSLVGAFSRGAGRTSHDIAFDSNGQLWGWDSASGRLWKINKTTGVATAIGAVVGGFGGGLDFDSFDTLWKVGYDPDDIGTVNTSTGAITFLRNTSDSNQVHSGKYDGLGLFWAGSPGGGGTAGTDLVTIDPGTGVVSEIAPFSVSGVGGLAWARIVTGQPDFSPILTPSSIFVSPGVNTSVTLSTPVVHGDSESITLSATSPAGITVTFDNNPITAGNTTTVHVSIGGGVSLGTYTVTIHCNGTDNQHDATLTVHVLAQAPGFHIAS